MHTLQIKFAQLLLRIKKSKLDNINVTNPQKHYQAIISFKNISIAAIIEKNFAFFNLIDKKLMANFSYIALFTGIFNMVINNNS